MSKKAAIDKLGEREKDLTLREIIDFLVGIKLEQPIRLSWWL